MTESVGYFARLKSGFWRALEVSQASRSGVIRQYCGADARLADSVRALIRNNDVAEAGFDRPLLSQSRMMEYLRAGVRVFQPGDIAGRRFKIARFIAEGGMGEVYAARDLELDVMVAIKTLRPAISADSVEVKRFKGEIEIAHRITHPNVSRIFDLCWHVGPNDAAATAFLTMELLDGVTLSQHLREHAPLDAEQTLVILRQICAGLDAAHREQIVHRDLKSGNVMLTLRQSGEMRAVITDFGLASPMDLASAPQKAKCVEGTPAYISPEQLEGKPLTPAADVYSLGIIAFEMLTGRLPFQADDPREIAEMRLRIPPTSPRVYVPAISRRWEMAILACLDREPARRVQLAGDLLKRVDVKRASRRDVLVAVAVGIALAATGGTLYWTRQPNAPTANSQAMEQYKLGLDLLDNRKPEDMTAAAQNFETAVSLDPGFKEAWIGLAELNAALANFLVAKPSEVLPKALAAAKHAIDIDRDSAQAWGILGYARSLDVRGWRSGEDPLNTAFQLDPHNAKVLLWYASFISKKGEHDKAIQLLKQALKNDPGSLLFNQQLASEYFRARDYDAAYGFARMMKRQKGNDPLSYLALARALEGKRQWAAALKDCDQADRYGNGTDTKCLRASIEAARGNPREAERLLAELLRDREHPIRSASLAGIYAQLGRRDDAIATLEEGFDSNDSSILTAPMSPYFDGLKGYPPWENFRKKIGI